MRAAVMSGFGPPEKLHIAEVPMPACRAGDVLIKVAAAGVNPVDWKECEGHLEQFYGAYTDPWVPGYDAAGIVAAVGPDVRGFRPGDRVVAFSDRRENGHNGTFADYVRVLANAVAHVPDTVALTDAAALPTAGLTGYQALFAANKAGLSRGDSVLIHGASGGVGSFAVQFAESRGLHIAASCSARNIDYVRSLGAELVLDYARGGIVAAVRQWRPEGVDAVIDCVSGGTLPDALDALRPGGRLLSIATLTQDGDVAGDVARAEARGLTKILSIIDFDAVDRELGEMVALIADGQVAMPPVALFPLDAAPEALVQMKAGGVRGKIVLEVRD
jgi:NADPH:quinone reductase-like Zn-dependent oxidoreductase